MDENERELIGRYVRGEASEAEVAEINRLLKAEPTAVQDLVIAADEESGLREMFAGLPTETVKRPFVLKSAPRRTKKPVASKWPWVAGAASLAACIALAVILNQPQPKPAPATIVVAPIEAPVIARIKEAVPQAVVLREGAELPVNADTDLRDGDHLRIPMGKSASVEYPDRTRVSIGSNTEATLAHFKQYTAQTAALGKNINLETGELSANVAKQPLGAPMLLNTNRVKAEVLGTELKLFAEKQSSRLDVIEGKVRVERLNDHAVTTVLGGEYAVAGEDNVEFLPRSITPRANIVITCDDRYQLFLNGELLGQREWPKGPWSFESQTYDLKLNRRMNTIAVKGSNIDNIAGLIAEISINFKRQVTGKNWKISQKEEPHWNMPGFNDAHWTSATEYGAVDVADPAKHARATLFPLNSKAQWIWAENNHFSPKDEAHNTVYFRYTFDAAEFTARDDR